MERIKLVNLNIEKTVWSFQTGSTVSLKRVGGDKAIGSLASPNSHPCITQFTRFPVLIMFSF